MSSITIPTKTNTSLANKTVVIVDCQGSQYFFDAMVTRNVYDMVTHSLVGKYTYETAVLDTDVFESIDPRKPVLDATFKLTYLVKDPENDYYESVLVMLDMFEANYHEYESLHSDLTTGFL